MVILVRLFWSRKLPCEMFPPHFSSLRCIGSPWSGRWTVIGSPSSSCQKSELIVAVFGFVVDRVSSRVTTGVFVFLDQRCSSTVSFTSLNSVVFQAAAARVFHFIEHKSLFDCHSASNRLFVANRTNLIPIEGDFVCFCVGW